jgi:hypothetical protein
MFRSTILIPISYSFPLFRKMPPQRTGRGRGAARGRGATRGRGRGATRGNQRGRRAPNATPDKLCTKCRQRRPIERFGMNRLGEPYVTCRDCRAARRTRYDARDDNEDIDTAMTVMAPRRATRTVARGDFIGWIPRSGIETVEEHYLGAMDKQCTFCGALHWLDERLKVCFGT